MKKNSKREAWKQQLPPGCRTCNGLPWVGGDGGMRRCTCPRGVWYLQKERQRNTKQRALFA